MDTIFSQKLTRILRFIVHVSLAKISINNANCYILQCTNLGSVREAIISTFSDHDHAYRMIIQPQTSKYSIPWRFRVRSWSSFLAKPDETNTKTKGTATN